MEKVADLLPVKTTGYGGIKISPPKADQPVAEKLKIKNFLQKNLFIILILLLASFLRLYRISDYMTFLGDEGRDVLIAKGILEGNLTLLGPRSSAADFFYGPIYYYMITPFLWLFAHDPVGPAVMVAFFGIATVFLVYKAGKEFFGEKSGLFAATLYAVSPLVIAYSRSSWNPNPLPFFSLLLLFMLYKAVLFPTWKRFFLVGLLLGIAMQFQYLTVFLGVIVAIFALAGQYVRDKKIRLLLVGKSYLQIFAGYIAGFSPFLLFEIRHGFPNIKTISDFILGKIPESNYLYNVSFTEVITSSFFRLFARLVTNYPPQEQHGYFSQSTLLFWQIATWILIVGAVFAIFIMKDRLKKLLFVLWLFIGIFLFGFYKRPIYDYYFGFLFPLPFLLVGNGLSYIFERSRRLIGEFIGLTIFSYLVFFNLQGAPFFSSANRQKEQAKQISEFVLSKTDNKPYNFALITPGNSDHGYRYFFSLNNKNPVTIENPQKDPMRKSVTDQLLIVCEDPNCKPLGDPLWEVAGFGRAEIAGDWDVSVVKVYKLVHYEGK